MFVALNKNRDVIGLHNITKSKQTLLAIAVFSQHFPHIFLSRHSKHTLCS